MSFLRWYVLIRCSDRRWQLRRKHTCRSLRSHQGAELLVPHLGLRRLLQMQEGRKLWRAISLRNFLHGCLLHSLLKWALQTDLILKAYVLV